MNYKAKRQARIERYKTRAEKASQESTKLHEKAHKMASVIPLGQPILIGHHSEKAHRNLLKRIHKKIDKAVEEMEKITLLERSRESSRKQPCDLFR